LDFKDRIEIPVEFQVNPVETPLPGAAERLERAQVRMEAEVSGLQVQVEALQVQVQVQVEALVGERERAAAEVRSPPCPRTRLTLSNRHFRVRLCLCVLGGGYIGQGNSQLSATSGPSDHRAESKRTRLIGCQSVRQWLSFLSLRTDVRA
jgi:hypothetical protein